MTKPRLQLWLIVILLLSNLGQAIAGGAAKFCPEPKAEPQETSVTLTSKLFEVNNQTGVIDQEDDDCCQTDCCDSDCICISSSLPTTAVVQISTDLNQLPSSPELLLYKNQKPTSRHTLVFRPPIYLS